MSRQPTAFSSSGEGVRIAARAGHHDVGAQFGELNRRGPAYSAQAARAGYYRDFSV